MNKIESSPEYRNLKASIVLQVPVVSNKVSNEQFDEIELTLYECLDGAKDHEVDKKLREIITQVESALQKQPVFPVVLMDRFLLFYNKELFRDSHMSTQLEGGGTLVMMASTDGYAGVLRNAKLAHAKFDPVQFLFHEMYPEFHQNEDNEENANAAS
ncbi:hypothetical protein [Neptuniibacter sp. QD37_11]|uniref:hypothetical protein n=1 Tax=Neptuniibacter sp. QD37_11 TaxID=3398209 RepID=UPI0039F4B5D3